MLMVRVHVVPFFLIVALLEDLQNPRACGKRVTLLLQRKSRMFAIKSANWLFWEVESTLQRKSRKYAGILLTVWMTWTFDFSDLFHLHTLASTNVFEPIFRLQKNIHSVMIKGHYQCWIQCFIKQLCSQSNQKAKEQKFVQSWMQKNSGIPRERPFKAEISQQSQSAQQSYKSIYSQPGWTHNNAK